MTNPAEKTEKPPELIVGLGNPGPKHRDNRHNAGFTFIDRLTDYARFRSLGIKLDIEAFGALVLLEGIKVLLVKPLNYMNNSGGVVRRVLDFGQRSASEMLVVHDDLDLPAGVARLKQGGGHGGHRGLRDVIEHCGEDFLRLRLGVGHPGDPGEVTPYVLSPPDANDAIALDLAMDASLKALTTLYTSGLQAAMTQLHTPTLH